MKAWIARDGDGHPVIFRDKPTWVESDGKECGWWSGATLPHRAGEANAFADAVGIAAAHCQPIELTASPIGEAVRGGE